MKSQKKLNVKKKKKSSKKMKSKKKLKSKNFRHSKISELIQSQCHTMSVSNNVRI